jgi:sec-independent protein translocase protein TatA
VDLVVSMRLALLIVNPSNTPRHLSIRAFPRGGQNVPLAGIGRCRNSGARYHGLVLGNIGPLEIVVVLIIALIVFGPKRLPELGRSLGKGIREFRGSLGGDDDDEDDRTSPPEIEPRGEPVGHKRP